MLGGISSEARNLFSLKPVVITRSCFLLISGPSEWLNSITLPLCLRPSTNAPVPRSGSTAAVGEGDRQGIHGYLGNGVNLEYSPTAVLPTCLLFSLQP